MTPIEADRLPVAVIEPSDEDVRWIRAKAPLSEALAGSVVRISRATRKIGT
jgi:hypothetical protein